MSDDIPDYMKARMDANGVLNGCEEFCHRVFPPYPEDWIILQEDVTDDVIPGDDGYPDEHYHYCDTKFVVIEKDRVWVNWATCWLSDDSFEPVWRGSQDSGACLTFAELDKIVEALKKQ